MLQEDALADSAKQLCSLLKSSSRMLVLAESCTSGAIAAALGMVPGVSARFCGSHVIYRNASKQAWLGIPNEILDGPGPVSRECSRALAEAALKSTREANLSLAITGDFGPGANPNSDGMIYLSVLDSNGRHGEISHHLVARAPRDAEDILGRKSRQQEATLFALNYLAKHLRSE